MARMHKNGKSLNEVITYAEKAREDARIHFMVGDLSYLEIGGRIGKVATISAGLLKIKLRSAGLCVVYQLRHTESSMLVIVIGIRADEEVYDIAQKRAHKHGLFD